MRWDQEFPLPTHTRVPLALPIWATLLFFGSLLIPPVCNLVYIPFTIILSYERDQRQTRNTSSSSPHPLSGTRFDYLHFQSSTENINDEKKERDREKSYWGLGWWRVLTDRIVIRSYWKYDTLVYRRGGPRARLVDLLWGHSVRIKAYGWKGRISIRSASKRGGWLSLIIDSHNAIAQFLWINEFPFLLHIKEKAMTIP